MMLYWRICAHVLLEVTSGLGTVLGELARPPGPGLRHPRRPGAVSPGGHGRHSGHPRHWAFGGGAGRCGGRAAVGAGRPQRGRGAGGGRGWPSGGAAHRADQREAELLGGGLQLPAQRGTRPLSALWCRRRRRRRGHSPGFRCSGKSVSRGIPMNICSKTGRDRLLQGVSSHVGRSWKPSQTVTPLGHSRRGTPRNLGVMRSARKVPRFGFRGSPRHQRLSSTAS